MIGKIDWSGSFEEIPDPPKQPVQQPDADWPKMAPVAFHGLAGEFVAQTDPDTESDPNALLLQYLVSFGNAVGRGPHCLVENTPHFANLFSVLVGDTSKARKGTSAQRVRVIYEIADPKWARECILGGMSSGEGLIYAVRDPVLGTKKGEVVVLDDGVEDKRLLLDEREFFQALTVLKREGSTLSRIIRDAWDCREMIGSLTKHSPTRATRPHISIVGHITLDELREKLDQTSMANGYANRYLFACVKRSKLLPFGGTQSGDIVKRLGERTRDVLTPARNVRLVEMTDAAMEHWPSIYKALAEGAPGLLGAITNRGEAQVIRLALIYALLDQTPQIDVVHLEAGHAVWRFCEASARYIFGDTQGNPVADTLLRELKNAGASGMTRTQLFAATGRNLPANKLDEALIVLQKSGKVRRTSRPRPTGGRAIETWFAV